MCIHTYTHIYWMQIYVCVYVYENNLEKGKQLTGLLQLTGVSIWKGYDLEGILC